MRTDNFTTSQYQQYLSIYPSIHPSIYPSIYLSKRRFLQAVQRSAC